MITTYYLYTDLGETKYNIHLISVICANQDNKPVPNYKVITPRRIEQADHTTIIEPRLVFSNFMVENGAVSRFNSCKYEETTSSLDNIYDSRWIPKRTRNSYGGVKDFYRSTYLCTLDLATKHGDNEDSKLSFLKSEPTNIGVPWFSPYVALNDTDPELPTIGEWPSPIVIRVDDGTIVRFYEPDDTSFSNPIYWQEKSNNIAGLNVIFVYNLIPNKTYNYKVFKKETNNSYTLKTGIYGQNNNYGTIRTEGQVRMIKFSCIRNARDIGGWPTLEGDSLKYGLVYRGSQLDGRGIKKSGSTYVAYTDKPYYVPHSAIDEPLDKKEFYKLNIGKEIDIRGIGTSVDTSAFGSTSRKSEMKRIDAEGTQESTGIDYYRCGEQAQSYQGWASHIALFINYLNAVIEAVANNKAAYVHCQQGKDRTGTFILLLLALCNVKSDALIKDYELSSMWTSSTYNRVELLQGNLKDGVSIGGNGGTSTLQAFNVTTPSMTIQAGVLKWFKDHYSGSASKIINRKTNSTITLAGDALDYIREVFVEKRLNVSTEVILLGGSRILNKASIYSSSGNLSLEIVSPLENGIKFEATGSDITLNNVLSIGEDVTGFKYDDTLINSIKILENKIIVKPNTTNNLISGYTSGNKWTTQAVDIADDGNPYVRYYLARRTGSFYALDPFFVQASRPVKLYFPSKTGTVKIEIIETGIGGMGPNTRDAQAAIPIGYGKATSLSLNSNHEATYTPTQSGFIFIDLASSSNSTGYTVFNEEEAKDVRAIVSNCKVPSFFCEKIFTMDGSGLSIVYYNNYVIHFKSCIQAVKIINVETKLLVKSFTFTYSGGTGVYQSSNHALAACMMPIKYTDSDFFPMILVGGTDGNGRVIRIVGSDPQSSSLSILKVVDINTPYNGELLYSPYTNTLYLSRYYGSGVLYKINGIDLTNISTYTNSTTISISESQFQQVGNYRVTGQDISIMNKGNNDVMIYQYGWLSGTATYYLKTNNLLGLLFSEVNLSSSQTNLIGFLSLTKLMQLLNGYNNTEFDGVAWAGNNTIYLMTNHPKNNLFKITLDMP